MTSSNASNTDTSSSRSTNNSNHCNARTKPKTKTKTKTKPQKPPNIKARSETDRKLLVAATEGDIEFLERVRRGNGNTNKDSNEGTKILRNTVCVSGCHLLHWAAGSNQVAVLEYLLSPLPLPLPLPLLLQPPGTDTNTNTNNTDTNTGNDPETATATNHTLAAPIFCDISPQQRATDLPVTACKKNLGRTPLHYASRNGCLEAVRYLVDNGADVGAKARQGVTPFQLAVWQNRLGVCRYLVEVGGHDAAADFNEFGCGAVHWLGIAPVGRANDTVNENENENDAANQNMNRNESDSDNDTTVDPPPLDGRGLLPLARWLAAQPGIDFSARQRQDHTALHKAAWGGHLALVKYLRTEHDLWDDTPDKAGNYAASLADMAHTPKHSAIACYLRHHCSRKRAESLAILGLGGNGSSNGSSNGNENENENENGANEIGPEELRRAYLARARETHPDRQQKQCGRDPTRDDSVAAADFDAVRRAYLHLTEEGGVGDQSNPAHSLNLMLRYVHKATESATGTGTATTKGSRTPRTAEKIGGSAGDEDNNNDNDNDDSFFKARLVAVLLEYGDKGIDLSNVKKKWKQVWPTVPFPDQTRTIPTKTDANAKPQTRQMTTADFLLERAGDVIRFERHGEKKRRVRVLLRDRRSSRDAVLRSMDGEP